MKRVLSLLAFGLPWHLNVPQRTLAFAALVPETATARALDIANLDSERLRLPNDASLEPGEAGREFEPRRRSGTTKSGKSSVEAKVEKWS